jgi:hypothetical protein
MPKITLSLIKIIFDFWTEMKQDGQPHPVHHYRLIGLFIPLIYRY